MGKSKASAAKKANPPKHRAMKAKRDYKNLQALLTTLGPKLKEKREQSAKQKPVNHADPNKVATRVRAASLVVDAGWSRPAVVKFLKEEGTEIKLRSLTNWVKAFREGDRALEDKPRSGRKVTVTTTANVKKWVTMHYRERFQSTRDTGRQSNCDKNTVSNALKAIGLKCRKTRRGLFLTDDHIQRRLEWCQAHKDLPVSYWEKIVWSDEKWFSTFCKMFGRNDCTWVFADEDTVTAEEDRNGKKVGVWAAINAHGKTDLFFYDGNMDGTQYRAMLKKMDPQLRKLMPTADHIFMQDGATAHTANATQDYLEECKINFWKKTEWPAKSPDLNPIENLWAILNARVMKRYPKSEAELKRYLKQEWAKISIDDIRHFVMSLPCRIKEVLAAHGWHTKY